jgi:hypothetical protein
VIGQGKHSPDFCYCDVCSDSVVSIIQCNQLIDVYGRSIMNVISQVADPRLVCMEIGVCKWNKQTAHVLGGKKCVWGPGYWCQSTTHAKACGVSNVFYF